MSGVTTTTRKQLESVATTTKSARAAVVSKILTNDKNVREKGDRGKKSNNGQETLKIRESILFFCANAAAVATVRNRY